MIETHPLLFNTIAAIFAAFTSAWLVFALTSKRISLLKRKIASLEKEKEFAGRQILQLKKQIEERYTHAGRATVISLLPPAAMAN